MRIDLIPTHQDLGLSERGVESAIVGDGDPGGTGVPSLGYREFFQSVYDAGVITDMAGNVLDVNRRAVDFFQYDFGAFCGLNVMALISGADTSLLDRIMDHLENEHFALIQAYCIRSDESMFPAEIAASRVKAEEPVLGFFIRDITVRRTAEEMLRTEHQAIQNAAEGIATTDLGLVVTYANPAAARMLGYERPDALMGVRGDDLFTDVDLATSLMDQVLQKGNVWKGEMEARRRDGSGLPVRVSLACTRDGDDEPSGTVLSIVDHSDHIRARAAERESEQQRVMLESLGTACHHLGQPSTVLIANLELLNRELREAPAHIKELVDNGMQAGERLSQILSRLRDIREYRPTNYLEDRHRTSAGRTRILDIH